MMRRAIKCVMRCEEVQGVATWENIPRQFGKPSSSSSRAAS
ncbi:hypothetical protein PVAG01_09006 [Phlyctema vagabunda]|uniref:Uncharacterized protein n=1 Tax=Phlyctema vagabunda TaxID=108571 RepID=A0ABR4P647_9HELO